MAQFYKILKADPLGDPYTPNFTGAKPTQTYWCQVEGVDKDVSIGKQVGNTLTPGQHVYGDLMYAKSQKGTEYWKFKSAKVPEGVTRPADSPAQAQAQAAVNTGSDVMPAWFVPIYNMLVEMNKVITGNGFVEPTPKPPVEPEKPEQIGGEPIDEETKKTLEDIFTPPETPEDIPADEGDVEPAEPAPKDEPEGDK